MISLAERHPGRTFAIIGLAFAVLYVAAFASAGRTRVINGDAIQYYAYLRSLVFDRDLDFANEYDRFYRDAADSGDAVWLHGRTDIGRSPNLMSIGPAILWSPLYLVLLAGASVARAAGAPIAVDGFSLPFQLAAGLAGIAYATIGVFLCYRAAALRFSRRSAFWSALVVWLASPAVYYTLVSPTYSHAVALFTGALFTFAWIRSIGQVQPRRFVLLGALGGIAALVRWQDLAVLFLCPAAELAVLVGRRVISATAALIGLVLMVVVAVAVASPQFIAWRAIYGHYFLIPQGTSFMRWTEPAILSVLFSTRHGLLLWTPALIAALAGLAWLWRRDAIVALGTIAAIVASIYINAAVSDWWAGEAFGSRRFVSDTVFFALGLAALGERMPATFLRIASLGAIAYNMLFLLQYQLYMRGYRDISPYPDTIKAILVDRLIVPLRFITKWLTG